MLTKFIKASITYSFILILLFSCRSNSGEKNSKEIPAPTTNYSKYLEEFKMVFPQLTKYNWEIYSAYMSEDSTEIEMQIEYVVKDTSIVCALQKYYNENRGNLDAIYAINRYYITISANGINYVYKTIGGLDTSYSYTFPGDFDDPSKRDFIQGEYNYKFEMNILNESERKYYLQHKDSLDLVKGNDLPGLPGIFSNK